MTNTNTRRLGAALITTVSILAGAAPAMATPHPYERDKALSLRAGVIAEHVADTAGRDGSPKGKAHAKPIRIRWADRGERELHPYGRGSYDGPGRSLRMIPLPGAGTRVLCRSGSKAARIAC